MDCENCCYYEWDEEEEAWFCTVNMDEDDYARLLSARRTVCPYFRNNDEYAVVRHQI